VIKPNSLVVESFSSLLFALFFISLLQWISKSLKDINLFTTDQLLFGMGVGLTSPLIYRATRLLISNLLTKEKKRVDQIKKEQSLNEVDNVEKNITSNNVTEKDEKIVSLVKEMSEKDKAAADKSEEKLNHFSPSKKEEINISDQNIKVDEGKNELETTKIFVSDISQNIYEINFTEEQVLLLKNLRDRLRKLNSKLYLQ